MGGILNDFNFYVASLGDLLPFYNDEKCLSIQCSGYNLHFINNTRRPSDGL